LGRRKRAGTFSYGAAACTLNCEGSEGNPHRGFEFYRGEVSTSVLEGITIMNGYQLPGGRGGGIFCRNSSSPTIRDCIIKGNAAVSGGGIRCSDCSPTISNCTITDNKGGGIGCSSANPDTTECTISRNSDTMDGGGIHLDDASARVDYCTISADSALQGGGIECIAGAEAILVNTILWDNCSGSPLTNGDEAFCLFGSSLTFARCCDIDTTGIQGGGAVDWSSPDNIFEDPLWVSPASCEDAPTDDGNYDLQAGSPCRSENSPPGCGRIGALEDGTMAYVSDPHPNGPEGLYLEPNRPNPFAPSTRIRFGIPAAPGISNVSLRVYDTRGRRVRTLIDAGRPPGVHEITWDGTDDCGRDVAAGMYFCRLQYRGESATQRMMLLK
jgi:hypothetical protein